MITIKTRVVEIVSENVKLTNVDYLLHGMVVVNLGPAITPLIFVLEQNYFFVTGLFFHCLKHGTIFILLQQKYIFRLS